MYLSKSFIPADTREPVAEMTIGDLLRQAVLEAPERSCLVEVLPGRSTHRRWIYAEALDEAEKVARILAAQFQPGERIALWAPNQAEWFFLQFGIALAGLTLVPMNPAFVGREAEYILGNSGASALFLAREYRGESKLRMWQEMRDRLPNIRMATCLDDWAAFMESPRSAAPLPVVLPTDPVMIQYTSGTTGAPKGVHQRHRNIVNQRLANQRLALDEGTVWLNFMPMFHLGGCVYMNLGTLWNRGTHVLMHGFDAALALQVIESESVGFFIGVPTMMLGMLEHPDCARRRLDSLRVIACGGTSIPPELVRRIESGFGARYLMIFGQTESCYSITTSAHDDSDQMKSETVGRPIGHVSVKVIEPHSGAITPCGTVGEICVQTEGLMIGYYQNPEATSAAIDERGWLHTGDLGSVDAQGYVRLTGRLKDMIIRGGENIFPREIEDALVEHPGVADVAVFGVPDTKWGEIPVAAVRLRPGVEATAADLETFLVSRLARHKIPRVWQFVSGFPLTASGKIQKFVMRQQYIERRPTVTGV